MLELNCLVQGDGPRNAFSIEIESTKNVSALQQVIRKRKEPALDHVPADTLVLWKVSIPATGLVKEDPRIQDLPEDESLLPLSQLSTVFSGTLKEGHIHVVVRAPHAGQSQSVCLAVSIAHQTLCPIHNAINDHPPLPRIITHAVIACLSSPSQSLIASPSHLMFIRSVSDSTRGA
jgi:hypothetical protein